MTGEAVGDDACNGVMLSVINSFGDAIPADDRDDIMQSSMLRCLSSHKDSYKQKFSTSLYRFVTWVCHSFIEDRDKKKVFPLPHHLRASWPDDDRLEHLRECMGLLNVPDRTFIEQRYLQRMTFREIGDIHGRGRQWAMRHVNAALGRLRDICLADS